MELPNDILLTIFVAGVRVKSLFCLNKYFYSFTKIIAIMKIQKHFKDNYHGTKFVKGDRILMYGKNYMYYGTFLENMKLGVKCFAYIKGWLDETDGVLIIPNNFRIKKLISWRDDVYIKSKLIFYNHITIPDIYNNFLLSFSDLHPSN